MANTRFKTHHGLNATANSYVDGKLEVTGDLVVSGNVAFSGSSTGDFRPDADQRNLGNTSLRWNLIGFAANLASTLTANGATTLSNTLLTTGAATFQNTVTIAGVTNVSSNVNVGGVTSVSNNLIVSGTGTVNGALTANGNTSFTNGLLTISTNSSLSNTVTVNSANVSVDSGTLFVDAVNNRVGINNTAPGVALRVTGAVDISSAANVQGNANVGGSLGVAGITTLSANVVLSGALQTIAGNSNFDSGVLFVDSVNNRVGVNNTAPTVALEVAGSANISTSVNSSLLTVGTGFLANSTAIVGTGYANITTSVNSALLTVGTSFIANTTGAYHTGVVNAASLTTTGIVANTSGAYPTSNTVGTALGSATQRWVVSANTGDFSTSVGVRTINSTSNGFFANSTTASVGNATDNVSITYSGITVSGADGLLPYSNIKGSQLGADTQRWILKAQSGDFSGNVSISGNLTVSGTTTYINTTNLNIGDNVITLNADLTNVTAPTEDAGIEVNRGSSANVSFLWSETPKYWALGNTNITGFANISTSVNSALLTVGTSFIANTTGAYHTGIVNAASVNSITVNAASHTVSTNFIANSTGVYHVGTVNAASYTTSGFVANTTAIVPTSNTILLGNTIGRWVLSANSGNFSGAITLGTTFSANGTTGTAGQVLLSGGVANAYWGSATEFTSDITIKDTTPAVIFNDSNETLYSNSSYLQYNGGNFLFVETYPTTNTRVSIAMSTGNITTDGEFIASSDERKKENIVTVDSALSLVDSMRGVYFTRKNSDERHVGVIAQEIQKVLPEVVSEDADGYLAVSYGNIVGVLIEAIKELKQEIEELKNGNQS